MAHRFYVKDMDCSKVNWKLKARNRNRRCHCVDWKIDWLVDFKITFAIYLFVDPFWYFWRYWFRCLLRRDATKGLGFAQWLFPSFAGAPKTGRGVFFFVAGGCMPTLGSKHQPCVRIAASWFMYIMTLTAPAAGLCFYDLFVVME